MSAFFHTIVIDPLYNLLVACYSLVPPHDFGIAIILTTLVIKIGMLHLSKKQIEGQRKMQAIQPEIKEVQKKYKDDKERQTRELLALYKKHNTTPVSGCLPIIIQLIIFIAFYQILFALTKADAVVDGSRLYAFIPNPGTMPSTLLGILDMHTPSVILALLAAASQYVQMKMMIGTMPAPTPKKDGEEPSMEDFGAIMTRQMLYIGPGLTLFIGITFPAGLALYWLVSSVFSVVQQWFVLRAAKRAA